MKEKEEEGKEINIFEYWLAAVLFMNKIQQKPDHHIVNRRNSSEIIMNATATVFESNPS